RQKTRLGKIMARSSGSLGFLANAIFALDDRRLFRLQRKRKLKLFALCGKLLRSVSIPARRPISIPDLSFFRADSRDSRSGAIDPFGVVKLAAVEIAQCQMCQIEIFDVPRAAFRFASIDRLTEKSKLKAEGMPIGGLHIPSRVPPFCLKFGMGEKVPRK